MPMILSMAIVLLYFAPGVLTAGDAAAAAGMARVPGGTYLRPLERNPRPRRVNPFDLDVMQVTNAEFLRFVRDHPGWRRSRVNRLFADAGYLKNWQGDLQPGPQAPDDAPVVWVSWFAARAYLMAVGKRLPTVDEWESTARASNLLTDASADPQFRKTILEWYARPNPAVPAAAAAGASNVHGIRGMHGVIWEWTNDFMSAMGTGESRADGSPDGQLFCGGAGLNTNNATAYADFMRFALRASLHADFCLATLGFRGARDAPPVTLSDVSITTGQ